MKRLVLLLVLLLAACQPFQTLNSQIIEARVNTLVVATLQTRPSDTQPVQTSTIQPKILPTETSTPKPNPTLPTGTHTLKPTFTATITKRPPTKTPTITPTPLGPIMAKRVTQTSIAVRLATDAAYKRATATEKASYPRIEQYELLLGIPESYIGEKVRVKGQVFIVFNDSAFQMHITGYRYPLTVILGNPSSDIHLGQWISVYGIAEGFQCPTLEQTQEVNVHPCGPVVRAHFYEHR